MNNWLKTLIVLLRTIVVVAGLLLLGWLLYGFNAPVGVCIGTLAAGCYLVWAGASGIPLASVWVVSLMSIAAVRQLWLRDVPKPSFQYAPYLLMANWLLALAMVWQLGKISDVLRQSFLHPKRVVWGLACLVVGVLAIGWCIYPQTISYLNHARGR